MSTTKERYLELKSLLNEKFEESGNCTLTVMKTGKGGVYYHIYQGGGQEQNAIVDEMQKNDDTLVCCMMTSLSSADKGGEIPCHDLRDALLASNRENSKALIVFSEWREMTVLESMAPQYIREHGFSDMPD